MRGPIRWCSHVSNCQTIDEAEALLSAWIQHERELQEADDLSLAALQGDLDQIASLIEGGNQPASPLIDCHEYRAGGVAWDQENRQGVTAGEIAIVSGQTRAFEALVDAGVADMRKRFALEESSTTDRHTYLGDHASYGERGCLIDARGMPVGSYYLSYSFSHYEPLL